MPVDVLMPVITTEGEDGVVTAWFVTEGSSVTSGQLIAEVQAEKVAGDITAPADGVVSGLVAINEPVAQGSPVCTIATATEVSATPVETDRVRASPAAKRRARELGIDLATVTATGSGGRISEADVEAAAGTTPPLDAERAQGAPSYLRTVIAERMRRSHTETAPVTLTTVADVTNSIQEHITAWVVRTTALCLADHPQLNGVRDGDRFVPAEIANITLAVQTDEGLTAPVIRNPAAMGLDDLAKTITSLAERARAKQLDAADFADGTFGVTNLGGYGIDAFTPLIDLPQIAILGVGAIRTVPAFAEDGSVVPRRVLTLSLTFDHAFIDGAPAAEFLAAVREALEALEAGG